MPRILGFDLGGQIRPAQGPAAPLRHALRSVVAPLHRGRAQVHKTRWDELNPLLDELLDLHGEARAQRMARIEREAPELAEALNTLLAGQDTMVRAGFLDAPAPLPERSLAGHVLGAYTVEREIGQGGMGTVWLARRTDGRFEGHVAVKVLSGPLLGHGAVERFEREGRILGRLSHPHIARLIDAGVDGQRPYLILEYVDGQPIDAHCSRAKLDLKRRVRLFLHVLDAVAHAHARLILHRDLKPSNILVSAAGEVKLLDFGIAKLLDDSTQPGAASELTRAAGNAYTPRFAAPEQIEGGDVTTATDVYALGVLLYLLLANRHPTEPQATASALEQLRAVVETVPPPASQAAAAQARELRGDLDTIVAKALKKKPAERYGNAALLAEDLQRWLDHVPIAARPDAALYRIAKFVRRHRVGVAASGLLAGVVVAGVASTWWQAREARQQQVQAEGLIEFMLGDLRTKLSPVGRLDVLDSVGARALDYYAAQSAGRLDAASLGRRSRALHLIGEIAELRGNLDDAARVFAQAAESTAELLARHPGDGQRVFDHAQSLFWGGYVDYQRGRLEAAEQAFLTYRDLAEQLASLDPDKPEWQAEVGMAYSNLGTVLLDRGRPAEALEALLRTRASLAALLPQRPALALEAASNHGWIAKAQEMQGELQSALDERQQQIALLRAMPDAPRDRKVLNALGVALGETARSLLDLGRLPEALQHARERLAVVAPLVQADPQNKAWNRNLALAHLQLAEALEAGGEHRDARQQGQLAQQHTKRLAQGAAVVDWQVFVRGSALALTAALDAADHRPGPRAELEAFVAELRHLPQRDAVLTARERLATARVHLALGDLHARHGRAGAAREQWLAVREHLSDKAEGNDPQALTLLAAALWRLGQAEQARELVRRVSQTPYRHPAYKALVLLMQRGAGPRSSP